MTMTATPRAARRTLLILAALAAAASSLAAQQSSRPWAAKTLAISEPVLVVALEGETLTGEPSRLSWSPDDNLLYLQTINGPFGRRESTFRHFIVAAEGGAPREMPAEPEWAMDYWIAKSDQASPDDPSVRIQLKNERRQERTTSVPQGGDLARGGTSIQGGTGRNDAIDAAFNSQVAFMSTMLLHGQQIGQFDNTVIVPGLTFGWGPVGSGVIAYAEPRKGRIFIMDADGERQEIDGTNDALLPGWSTDGTRLAWFEKDGRGRFVVRVARVSQR
jgi:hypothetical protein